MRLIDADALKKRLDYCTTKGMGSTIAFTFKHIIDEQPTIQPEPKWIPCKNDLPDIGMTVLFCDIDGDEFIGHRALYWWWCVDEKVKNVIAWMPLPEPYKPNNK